ncbi:hypothetical protein JHK84_047857 [Glycine max]|nr:hypothetical protein JHK86_047834 [Glycine max]KAG4943802.1 hypothetical protein JHK85_048448 [Glycine max]KAG5102888.1 hypothetical protein JHK84_047857 [Glycine max]
MSQRSNASSSRTRVSSQVVLFCGCGRRAVRRVAGTNINRGRAFFTCSINKGFDFTLGVFDLGFLFRAFQDEVGYCGYFIWVDQLIEALGVDDSLGTFSMEQRRQFGREEDKTMWKAQVNSKLDCVGIEMKMLRTIVYGMFLIQLLSMVLFVCIHKY